MVYIYGLIDPLVHQIAYVGKTNDLNGRLQSHISTTAQHTTGQWIKRLRSVNARPSIVVLELMEDDGDWDNSERWWISHGLRMGWPLTNTVHVTANPVDKESRLREIAWEKIEREEDEYSKNNPLPIDNGVIVDWSSAQLATDNQQWSDV